MDANLLVTNFIQQPLPPDSTTGAGFSGQPGALGHGQRAATALITCEFFVLSHNTYSHGPLPTCANVDPSQYFLVLLDPNLRSMDCRRILGSSEDNPGLFYLCYAWTCCPHRVRSSPCHSAPQFRYCLLFRRSRCLRYRRRWLQVSSRSWGHEIY